MISNLRLAALPATLFLAMTAAAQNADVSSGPPSSRGFVGGTLTTQNHTQAPFLYTNGPFVTGTGNGVGGADTSLLEANFTTFGYGAQGGTVGNRVADDFVVPAGQNWTLSKLHWRTYQTGAPTSGTITGINVNIWNSTPTTGGVPLWSGPANSMLSKTWTNCYRVQTVPGDSQRAIIDVVADMTAAPVLAPGTYWVDVQLVGTLASGPWAPPTDPHAASDNARQFTTAGGWAAIVDALSLLPQDFPFVLEGDDGTGGGCGTTTSYCTAKTNSNGCSPSLSVAGSVGLTGVANVSLNNLSEKPGAASHVGQIFWSTAGANGVAFNGGFLCVKSPIVRIAPAVSFGGTAGATTCLGTLSQNINASLVAHGATSGQTVFVQGWARDTAAFQGIQLSDAFSAVICP